MITGIKINNIRNLDFDDYLQLAPMTILLGKNSSGKSTFLRTFPLIKQTLEIRRSAPLLWYGNLVDFGSFEETVNKFSNDKIIKLSFKTLNNSNDKTFKTKKQTKSKSEIIETSIEISSSKESENDYISKIQILKENLKFILIFNNKQELDSIELNETILNNINLKYNFSFQELIPTKFYSNDSNQLFYNFFQRKTLHNKIFKKILEILENEDEQLILKSFTNNKKKVKTEFNLFNNIDFFLENDFPEEFAISKYAKDLGVHDKTFFVNQLKTFLLKNNKPTNLTYEELNNLKNLLLMTDLPEILQNINMEIYNYFNNVFYIAPLRATAQRYYRIQGLDVEDIDPMGANLPVYFKNLSKNSQNKFSKWTEENFNFKPKLTSKGGHISLVIQKGNEEFNLADTGFGFSQVLPILLQIWSKIFNNEERIIFLKSHDLIFLIEQPELHLHPAMQATLVDIFIKAISLGKKKGINIKFILETHSETIINRVGRHIIEENFKNENVEMIIFENEKDKLKIIKTNITSEGIIEKWPLGFFEPKELLK